MNSNQKQEKPFTCHKGKGKVTSIGDKTTCSKRNGKMCKGSGSPCSRT